MVSSHLVRQLDPSAHVKLPHERGSPASQLPRPSQLLSVCIPSLQRDPQEVLLVG